MAKIKAYPPSGLLLWLFRAPIWLYRNGLGWVLGKRFLMFTHTGRKTGRKFQTVVEVVQYDPKSDRYFIASGWGERAQWLKNILVEPEIEVIVGRRKFRAIARRLDNEYAVQALLEYAQLHPFAFKKLSKSFTGEELPPDREGAARLAGVVPVVAVDRI